MANQVKASTSKTDAATKDFLPLLKTLKETGDILKGLAEAAWRLSPGWRSEQTHLPSAEFIMCPTGGDPIRFASTRCV